jgi:phenylacetate-coenzyme A ligase PaaK-like adenylate-forming protein
VIDAIQGRTEDTLQLPGVAGANVAIHPNVIHNVLDGAPVGGWQVVQESDHLRVLVAEPQPGFEAAALAERLHLGLMAQGALSTPVVVEQVPAIPRTSNGKAPLIRALKR